MTPTRVSDLGERGSRRSLLTRVIPMSLAASLAVGGAVWAGGEEGQQVSSISDHDVSGTVRDENGKPLPGARVTIEDTLVISDGEGRFSAELDRPAYLRASAPGHLDRAQAIRPGGRVDVLLTSDADHTVSIRYGGDVMFGRRFYERQNGNAPALTKTSGAADHAALLDGVRPLLEDGDLSVVNLETPLGPDPYYKGKRPARFHPTKDLAFASSPAAALGLKNSGVDVVGLGNNHVMDLLGPGMVSTLAALDAAGMPHFGAGRNAAEAWKPAVVTRKNRKIAFIGCTSVSGNEHAIPYVAAATRAGAALCEPKQLTSAVQAAKKQADEVVVQIHGGVEYQRAQTPEVLALYTAAARAGASAVVGGHSHVVGDFRRIGTTDVIDSTGNLLFDQDLWSTYPSYVARLDLRGGRSVSTTADPVALIDYRPQATVGSLADSSARFAATNGTLHLTGSGAASGPTSRSVATDVSLRPGQVSRIASSWSLIGGSARAGTDLLYGTGDFEPVQVPAGSTSSNGDKPPVPSKGDLWRLGRFADVRDDSACGTREQQYGVELLRSPVSKEDAFVSPAHRVPVRAGTSVSLLVDVRTASAGGVIQLKWYRGSKGESVSQAEVEIPEVRESATSCRLIRLNATVPRGVSAALPFVRLTPPSNNVTVNRLRVDRIRLVAWAPQGATGRAYDTVGAEGLSTAVLMRDAPARSDESPLDAS